MVTVWDRIYKRHVWRERSKTVPPGPYPDEEERSRTEEDDLLFRGLSNPENTVSLMVPLTNEWGDQYGARLEKITPESAGHLIDSYREDMVNAREMLWKTRFWLRVSKGLLVVAFIAIAILSLGLVMLK